MYTLRHWKATMLYHQTKDILYVMKFLGHKNIRDTLIYVTIESTIFGLEDSDEFTVKVAETLKDACDLLEAGFEYVTDMDGKKLFASENSVSFIKNDITFSWYSHRIFYTFPRLI